MIGYHPNVPRGSVFWLSVPLQSESIKDWSFGESGWFAASSKMLSNGGGGNDADSVGNNGTVAASKVASAINLSAVAETSVLICDDSTLNQTIFVRFMNKLGVKECALADEGASALQWLLERAKKKQPKKAFVLLDMSMPGLLFLLFLFFCLADLLTSYGWFGDCANVARAGISPERAALVLGACLGEDREHDQFSV